MQSVTPAENPASGFWKERNVGTQTTAIAPVAMGSGSTEDLMRIYLPEGPIPNRGLFRGMRRLIWKSFLATDLSFRLRGRPPLKRSNGKFWVAGFPRSGNTFAGTLLRRCLPKMGVEFHIHAFPEIQSVCRTSAPGFTVIRNPLDACISWTQYQRWPLYQSLQDYIDHHESLAPSRGLLPTVDFTALTGNPTAVLAALQKRFILDWQVPEINDETNESLFKEIEHFWTQPDGTVRERQVARPSPAREPASASLREAIHADSRLENLLKEAEGSYREWISSGPCL